MAATDGGLDPTELMELAGDLKHDVGKYVAWMSANLDEVAWTGPVTPLLVEALSADILRTRSAPGADPEPVWSLWRRQTQRLPRPLAIEELRQVESAVEVLEGYGATLRSGDVGAIGACRAEIRTAQQTIRQRLSDFHRRLRQERG